MIGAERRLRAGCHILLCHSPAGGCGLGDRCRLACSGRILPSCRVARDGEVPAVSEVPRRERALGGLRVARGRRDRDRDGERGTAIVVSLSFGERGESGSCGKEDGQTLENVKAVRRAEAEAGGGHSRCRRRLPRSRLSARDGQRGGRRVDRRDARHRARRRARAHARQDRSTPTTAWPPTPRSGRDNSRAARSGERVSDDHAAGALLFEPHQPELSGFVPTTFLDITPVWEQKLAAMRP